MTKLELFNLIKQGLPLPSIDEQVRRWKLRNLKHFMRGIKGVVPPALCGCSNLLGTLSLKYIGKDGRVVDLGLASLRVVTTVGVGYIVDAFQNSVELENMKYHGIGEDNTAEAVGDTDLVSELTTEYSTDNTRATGTTTEGATGNIYKTVATNTVDASAAIVEHGVFSAAAVGSGVLLDRSVFSVINLSSGDGIQSTYQLTLTAGS